MYTNLNFDDVYAVPTENEETWFSDPYVGDIIAKFLKNILDLYVDFY